ncbi:hypothetical protein PHISCL_08995 [Aspergillus sclerotialis]|uniref:Aminotransferase class I/classII large domain-containing protein n=1 Tax=Aspergillus sclerotialis TaxID=2070753 RepID=A0A3A2Z8X2_9EURO|nr:hypothetical protein PHISCL_08995 [Aspergillus sclerotialis]
MGSLSAPTSRASKMLSSRGQTAREDGSKGIIWDVISNLWHPETNPDGYVSVGVAENILLHDYLVDYLHANLKLPTRYLTYNDGGTGSGELKGAVSHFLNRHLKPFRPIEPSHVVMTNGCSSAVEQLSWAFTEPGEGILLGRPYYGTFITDISLRPGAEVVPVEFDGVDPLGAGAVARYEKALVDFEANTGKRVRAVMLCHPHNPLGRCYPRSVLIELMKFCQARQLHLISDEIYALSTWENKVDPDNSATKFESVLSIDTANVIDPDLVHVLWGMSKDFGANGLRVGTIISQSNPDLQMALKATSLYSYVSGLSDQITAAILRDDAFTDKYIQLNREGLSNAHEYMARVLQKFNIEYLRGCNAGFFLWINLGKKYLEANPENEGVHLDLTATIMQKLLEKKVFLANGTGFGSEKPGWFRVVFAHPIPYLEEAMRRILAAILPENYSAEALCSSLHETTLNASG